MTIWIEKSGFDISDDYTFAAYLGFRQTGYIVQFFSKPEKIHYKKGDVVVGCIQAVRHIMKKLKIELPDLYIPEGLEKYTGRDIYKSTVGEALQKFRNGEKVFIKPIQAKVFPAQVIESMPLMTHIGQTFNDYDPCWISSVVNFVSEYRLFLTNGELVGCKHYWGDFKVSLNWKVIDQALADLKWQPRGWCLDFGVTDKGETLLIEANDGYSIGNYGLDGWDYSKLIKARFLELTGEKQ
jgi:hypothetical protein